MTQKIANFKRLGLLALFHYTVFCLTLVLAYLIRFDFSWPPYADSAWVKMIFFIAGAKCLIFGLGGHFSGWWFYVTIKDLAKLGQSAFLCFLLVFGFAYLRVFESSLPRSVPVIDFFLSVCFLGGVRASWRVVREEFVPFFTGVHQRRVLFVGADLTTGRFAYHLHADPDMPYRVVGFLSPDPAPVRQSLGHIPVLGNVEDLEAIVHRHHINDLFILAGTLSGNRLRKIMKLCGKINLELKVIPQAECRLGNQTIPIRKINIEDLLQRDPVRLDDAVIRSLVHGRRVMVTGAGGSIGSEICRNLMKYEPKELILLGRGENRIFFIEGELQQHEFKTKLTPVIADVSNLSRMTQIFSRSRPEIIFHAAAHKHVPLMEDNVSEAVRNNVSARKTSPIWPISSSQKRLS